MKLIAELQKLGIRTGYIKRTSEDEAEPAASDTGQANALGVRSALWGPSGIRVSDVSDTLSAYGIASEFFPESEIVILEGGKFIDLPRIWVENGESHDNVSGIFMRYDRKQSGGGPLIWSCGDEPAMAAKLASTVRGKFYRSSAVYIGDAPLPMKDFIADFIKGSILGMLSSLKGGKNTKETIRVYIPKK